MVENSGNRIHEQAAIGFERAADAYERGRPDYPAAAVDHLVGVLQLAAGVPVAELGAGTGKFTRPLVETGAEIVAVEPVEAMRLKLRELLPGVAVVAGTAEAIPLPDSSVNAVVAAQAFHWFRGDDALAEIHRVLKPGGGLGLIWNARELSAEWLRELTRIIEPYEACVPHYTSLDWMAAFESSRLFSPLQRAKFPYVQTLGVEATRDRIASISFIAAMPDSQREGILEQVRQVVQAQAEKQGKLELDFPYRTDVYTCRRIDKPI